MASQNSRTINVALNQNLAALDNSPLMLDGGTTGINGVTVINNSPLTIRLFRGSQQPSGQSLVIAPYQYMAIPASNVKYVALQFGGTANVAGEIDIQWTSDLVVALASSLLTTQLSSDYPAGATPWSCESGACQLTTAAQTFTFPLALPFFQAGQKIYLSSLRISGHHRQSIPISFLVNDDAANTIFEIDCGPYEININPRPAIVSALGVITPGLGSAQLVTYGQSLPIGPVLVAASASGYAL